MAFTHGLVALGGPAPGPLWSALAWLLRPQDGPAAVLLGLVVVCGLLGWASARRL